MDAQKKCPSWPADRSLTNGIAITLLSSGPRPLTFNKLENIKVLIKFILPVYHTFYTSLDSNTSVGISSETDEKNSN